MFLVLFSYHHMHLSLSIPINMCGILFNILSVFSLSFLFFLSLSLSLSSLLPSRFVCAFFFFLSCQLFDSIFDARWLLFVAGERDDANVWLAVFVHCIHIDRIFLHKFFYFPYSKRITFFALIAVPFGIERYRERSGFRWFFSSLPIAASHGYTKLDDESVSSKGRRGEVPSFSFYLSAAVGSVFFCFLLCFWLFLSYLILLLYFILFITGVECIFFIFNQIKKRKSETRGKKNNNTSQVE